MITQLCSVEHCVTLASAIQVFCYLPVLPTVKGCLSIGRVAFFWFWYWSQLWKLPSDLTELHNDVKLIWTRQIWKLTHLKALVVLLCSSLNASGSGGWKQCPGSREVSFHYSNICGKTELNSVMFYKPFCYCSPGQQIHANSFVLPEDLFLCNLICVSSCCAVSAGVRFLAFAHSFVPASMNIKLRQVELWPPTIAHLSCLLP